MPPTSEPWTLRRPAAPPIPVPMSDTTAPPYPQIVFSGGGTRCFWHGGFMEVARERLAPAPERIACVSGGVLSATTFVAHRGHRLLDVMAEAFERQDSNVVWHDLVEGTGLTPHQSIYREVVTEVLGDAEARDAVAGGPSLEVMLAHPPGGEPMARVTGALATIAYEAELHILSRPDMEWAEAAGLETSRVDARRAAREGRLVDLVCAAAVIPPIFDPVLWDGRPVVDAGMAGHAPHPEPDRGATLVLATRTYRNWPEDGRTYVGPSDAVPADKIDFTDPGKIRRTWEAGEEDARRFLAEIDPERPEDAGPDETTTEGGTT